MWYRLDFTSPFAGFDLYSLINNIVWTIKGIIDKISIFVEDTVWITQELQNQDQPFDGSKYAYNIKEVAGLYSQVEEWRQLEVESRRILQNEKVKEVAGTFDFGLALVEFSNKGMLTWEMSVLIPDTFY